MKFFKLWLNPERRDCFDGILAIMSKSDKIQIVNATIRSQISRVPVQTQIKMREINLHLCDFEHQDLGKENRV